MVYRYADVLLKKAEALNELGHPDQAAAPLNIVRHRAGLADVPTTLNQETMREKIIHERRMELAFEGHRWFDLRRTTRPRMVKVLQGKTYILEQDDPRYTIPIPRDAIAANPGLAN